MGSRKQETQHKSGERGLHITEVAHLHVPATKKASKYRVGAGQKAQGEISSGREN